MIYAIQEQYEYKSDGSCKWKVIERFEDRELALKELANLRYFDFRNGLYRLIEEG